MAKFRTFRTIENQTDGKGRVTTVKCSNCSWNMPVDGEFDSDSAIQQIYSAFSAHDCGNHR
jgi:hypothetical protein